jgi:CDGSH-type Zn-finger protein
LLLGWSAGSGGLQVGPMLSGAVFRVKGCAGHRAENTQDMSRDDVTITPYRDGPLLVRGPVRMTDQDGNEIALDRGTVALCRCGKSRMRPFCDGSHKIVQFKAPSGAEARGR